MPNGYAVQLDELERFKAEVDKVVDEYQLIVGQLAEAGLRSARGDKTDWLVGAPELLCPSGPPVDFTNASRELLGNYDSLLTELGRVHAAIGAQFAYMSTALGETHGLYAQTEGEHTNRFQSLLGDRSSDGS